MAREEDKVTVNTLKFVPAVLCATCCRERVMVVMLPTDGLDGRLKVTLPKTSAFATIQGGMFGLGRTVETVAAFAENKQIINGAIKIKNKTENKITILLFFIIFFSFKFKTR